MKLIKKISTIVLGAALVAAVGVSAGHTAKEVKAKNVISTLTFTKACSGAGIADDGIAWTITSDAAESVYDSTKGIHYGTGKLAVSYLTLTSEEFDGTISSVTVNASGASNTTATISCTVGGNDFGTQGVAISKSATNYTFTGSASGSVVVSLQQSSDTVALYVKSVVVAYDDGETAVPVTGVAFANKTASVLAQKTLELEPIISPADASNKNVSWSSDNEEVATVENGIVTGVKPGTANITVKTEDGNFTDVCAVTVNENPNKVDTLNVTTLGFPSSYGDTKETSVSCSATYMANGTINNSANMQMRTTGSNSGIVTLKTGGIVKSVSVNVASGTNTWQILGKNSAYKAVTDLFGSGADVKGTVLTSNDASATFVPEADYQFIGFRSSSNAIYISSITVEWEPVKPTSIDVDDDSIDLTIGGSIDLVPELINGDLIVSETEVEYSSDNAAATVDASGHVVAVSAGSANITIKSKADSTVTKTVAVNVSATKTPVSSVELDKTELSLNETHTEQLSATVLPEEASIKTVEWSSSDDSVATVDQTGLVTAVKAGEATIKVESTDDKTKYAECAVTVTERPTASYELVTEDSQLVVGAKYIVVGAKSDTYYAMGHYVSGNNIPAFEISEPESGIFTDVEETLDSYAYILGGESGAYTFFDGANYIYAAGANSNNQLKATDTLSAKCYFGVAFSDSIATVVCTDPNTSRNTLRFNSTLFACYASDSSTGSLPQLYRLVPEVGSADEFAMNFLEETGAICATAGSHASALEEIWDDLAAAYNGLGATEKAALVSASASALVKAAIARYDYLVSAYELTEFIQDHVVSGFRSNYISAKSNNNTSITVVIIVSLVSVTSLGVLITLKKRKTISK